VFNRVLSQIRVFFFFFLKEKFIGRPGAQNSLTFTLPQ